MPSIGLILLLAVGAVDKRLAGILVAILIRMNSGPFDGRSMREGETMRTPFGQQNDKEYDAQGAAQGLSGTK